MRRSRPLKRRGLFKPGSTLKRNPPRRRDGVVSIIWRRDLGPCVVCPAEGATCRGPVTGHHIIPKSKLRDLGFAAYLMDLRNRLAVCEYRHEQHTTAYKLIPRELLPASVFEFADELGLGWYLDRHYKQGGIAA